MSDAMSDAMKPSYWESFFDSYEEKIINNEKLMTMIEEYYLTSKTNGVNYQRDLYPQKKVIMESLLNFIHDGKSYYYSNMYLEEWRWPSDWYFDELIECNHVPHNKLEEERETTIYLKNVKNYAHDKKN